MYCLFNEKGIKNETLLWKFFHRPYPDDPYHFPMKAVYREPVGNAVGKNQSTIWRVRLHPGWKKQQERSLRSSAKSAWYISPVFSWVTYPPVQFWLSTVLILFLVIIESILFIQNEKHPLYSIFRAKRTRVKTFFWHTKGGFHEKTPTDWPDWKNLATWMNVQNLSYWTAKFVRS